MVLSLEIVADGTRSDGSRDNLSEEPCVELEGRSSHPCSFPLCMGFSSKLRCGTVMVRRRLNLASYRFKNTKFLGLKFHALLNDGARELRFERVTMNSTS